MSAMARRVLAQEPTLAKKATPGPPIRRPVRDRSLCGIPGWRLTPEAYVSWPNAPAPDPPAATGRHNTGGTHLVTRRAALPARGRARLVCEIPQRAVAIIVN